MTRLTTGTAPGAVAAGTSLCVTGSIAVAAHCTPAAALRRAIPASTMRCEHLLVVLAPLRVAPDRGARVRPALHRRSRGARGADDPDRGRQHFSRLRAAPGCGLDYAAATAPCGTALPAPRGQRQHQR